MALQDADLFVVQRGATAHRATAASLKPYFASTGGLAYQGATNAINPPPPGPYSAGDLWIHNGPAGTVNAGWAGIAGQPITPGMFLIWNGDTNRWDLVGGGYAGVEEIIATLPLEADAGDPARPVLSIKDASTTQPGVVALATSAEAISGTNAAKALTPAAAALAYMPRDISVLTPLP